MPDISELTVCILLIGAGRAGSMLLRVFSHSPNIRVIGVVDINPEAPGLALARELGIPVAEDYHPFLLAPNLSLIINVTGDLSLQQQLQQEKPADVELVGGVSAMLIWMLVDEYKKMEILEDRFNIMMRELERFASGEFIIGKTAQMREIASLISRVAPTPTTVLIRGESGTGKEVVARMIHRNSPWKDRPLITVNCTAFSPTLIESELFGYKKGAFTGAVSDRTGLLELANNGTLFLDEIGDMPLEIQAKLLRFLQSGEVRAIGDNVTRKVKVRIIAATNRKLEEAVDQGAFRADLLYRLNAFTLYLPPLRERREDIPLLAYHFLKIAQAKVNKRVQRISPEAMAALKMYDWPGNLRELENVIERAVVLAQRDEIKIEHLPLTLQPRQSAAVLPAKNMQGGFIQLRQSMIDQIEFEALCKYLQEHGGNISQAAKAAKISRRTFHRLMAKHRIQSSDFRPEPPS